MAPSKSSTPNGLGRIATGDLCSSSGSSIAVGRIVVQPQWLSPAFDTAGKLHKSSSGRSDPVKPLKRRLPRFRLGALVQPISDAQQIDACGSREMLQVGCRLPDIA